MARILHFCFLWAACLIYQVYAEEIPFEKEPHPYTITFFQIPQNGEEASTKEKKAVKESNIGTGKTIPNNNSKVKVKGNVVAKKKEAVPGKTIDNGSNSTEHSAVNNQTAVANAVPSSIGVPEKGANVTKSQNTTSTKRTVKDEPAKKKIETKAQKKVVIKENSLVKASTQNKVNTKINHEKRKKVANFVSIVNPANARDHALSFQKGAMKHPQHTMYPVCHHCTENSTYANCIKRRTLKKCNEGLNNICFTRSVKRNSIIHYEMGCADHNTCLGARAFPCRDGSEKCFTCCQWDKCNSSPHHGDYELDSINLDELESSAMAALPSYLITLSVVAHAIAAYIMY